MEGRKRVRAGGMKKYGEIVTTRTNIQDWQCFFITIVVNAALFDK